MTVRVKQAVGAEELGEVGQLALGQGPKPLQRGQDLPDDARRSVRGRRFTKPLERHRLIPTIGIPQGGRQKLSVNCVCRDSTKCVGGGSHQVSVVTGFEFLEEIRQSDLRKAEASEG
jgi:hypothetical protein